LSLIVTGTGTGIGKTVTCAVLLARYGRGIRLAYWKPVATGGADDRDSASVKRWCGHLAGVLDEVYLFEAPLSPHLAARRENAAIDPEAIVGALVRHGLEDPDRSLVVEGAGGLLVPLTDQGYLLADLLRELYLPCLVAASSRLGTINHTLLTLEALRARGLEVAGVVLNGPPNRENRLAIERFGRVEVVGEIGPLRRPGRTAIARAARGFDRDGRLRGYLE
jgi:dethiobiotin synthase